MKKLLLLVLCLFLTALGAVGQTRTISGVVNDANGSLIGASVIKTGTSDGVLTDVDGNFTLRNVTNETQLTISYAGYVDKTIVVGNSDFLNILLDVDALQIEQVVITGYGGTQLRSKVTNSISTVDDKVFQTGVYNNPAQALSGAVAGLRVANNSGKPGAAPTMILRGGTNFDGTGSPLVVIDGQLRSSLSDINPEDIESMEVLKDAGATALYGARASNGVILVTTKSGKKGKSTINVKVRVGVNFDTPLYDFLGAEDYLISQRLAVTNSPWANKNALTGSTGIGTGNDVLNNKAHAYNVMAYNPAEHAFLLEKGWQLMKDPVNPSETIIFKSTNAYDYNIVNPTLTQDYNLNMSGGNDKGSYYAGIGYHKAEGAPLHTYYERFNMTFNGDYKITDFLKSITNFSYNRANWDDSTQSGDDGAHGNYFGRVMSIPPTVRFEDEEGNLLPGAGYGDGNAAFQNPRRRFNQADKFTMIQSFDATILPTLSVRASANWYYNESLKEAFTQDFYNGPINQSKTRNTSASFDRYFTQTYNVVLDYNETYGEKHNFGLMGGFEYFEEQRRGFSASGSGAPTDDFGDLGLTNPGENMRGIDSWHSNYAIASFFGRLNYDFDNKYLFSAVFRYDGYSSLLGDNRWGAFPGVSAGWIFSREGFVADNLDWLSFGKIRASFGINGNATGISPYGLQGSYASANTNGDFNYNGNVGYLISGLPNPFLRWEQTQTFEVGMDLSFLKNRLNLNVTYYNRVTSDKYANLSLPPSTGFSSIQSNNGEFQNQGVEIDLSAVIINAKDWNWTFGGNISYNKNTIVNLPDNGLGNNRQGGQQVYTGKQLADGTYEKTWVGGFQEGQEPGVLVGFVSEGIFGSQGEVAGDLQYTSFSGGIGSATNRPGYGLNAYNNLSAADKAKSLLIGAGDVKWKDINGDGIIDQYDQVVLGNLVPRWTGGLNTTLTWKDLSLYIRADFALDYMVYDWRQAWIMGNMQGQYNALSAYHDTWTPTNTGASLPKYVWADQLGLGNYDRRSTLMTSRGDYLALREVTLTYNLPKAWSKVIAAQNVQFGITGQNLAVWTENPNLVSTEKVGTGVDTDAGYALPQTLIFSLNITF